MASSIADIDSEYLAASLHASFDKLNLGVLGVRNAQSAEAKVNIGVSTAVRDNVIVLVSWCPSVLLHLQVPHTIQPARYVFPWR